MEVSLSSFFSLRFSSVLYEFSVEFGRTQRIEKVAGKYVTSLQSQLDTIVAFKTEINVKNSQICVAAAYYLLMLPRRAYSIKRHTKILQKEKKRTQKMFYLVKDFHSGLVSQTNKSLRATMCTMCVKFLRSI